MDSSKLARMFPSQNLSLTFDLFAGQACHHSGSGVRCFSTVIAEILEGRVHVGSLDQVRKLPEGNAIAEQKSGERAKNAIQRLM